MSARFAAAMLMSHNIVTKFEIWVPGGTAAVYESVNDYAGCAILDGNVTFSKDSDQRSQMTITLTSPNGSLIPTKTTDPITPWGNEMRIFTGVQYPDGTTEYCPMGCFRMNQVQITEQQGAIQMVVSGYDRSYNISRNVVQLYWPDATTLATLFKLPQSTYGVLWPYVIQMALSQQWPYLQYTAPPAQWVTQMNDQTNAVMVLPLAGATNSSFQAGTDLFDQMRQYARAAGCDLWLNRSGVCDFKTDPVVKFFQAGFIPTPVASYVEGPGAVFDQFQRTLSDAQAYNRVIVTGNGNIVGLGPTLTSFVSYINGVNTAGVFADDNDPLSPTFIGQVDQNPSSLTYGQVTGPSKYGVVTNLVTNNLLVSQVQVNNFATLTLRLNVGTQESITLSSMMTDPRLEIDDCIQATRTRDGVVDIFYIISGATVPLTNKQNMQLTVREKRNLK